MNKENAKKSERELNKIIGRNIIIKRTAKNMSRKDLAKRLGLSTIHLGLIEKGIRGTNDMILAKLRQIFDKPIDIFFYENFDAAWKPSKKRFIISAAKWMLKMWTQSSKQFPMA